MAKNPIVRRWGVSGSNGAEYVVSQRQDDTYACSCPAWKFARAPKEDCKHIDGIRAQSGDLPNVADQQSRKRTVDTSPIRMPVSPADDISQVCLQAVTRADITCRPIYFTLKGAPVLVHPGDTETTVYARWKRTWNALQATNQPSIKRIANILRPSPEPKQPAKPAAKTQPVEYMLTTGKRKFRPEIEP